MTILKTSFGNAIDFTPTWIREEGIFGETDEQYKILYNLYAALYTYLVKKAIDSGAYTVEELETRFKIKEIKECFRCKGINLDILFKTANIKFPTNCSTNIFPIGNSTPNTPSEKVDIKALLNSSKYCTSFIENICGFSNNTFNSTPHYITPPTPAPCCLTGYNWINRVLSSNVGANIVIGSTTIDLAIPDYSVSNGNAVLQGVTYVSQNHSVYKLGTIPSIANRNTTGTLSIPKVAGTYAVLAQLTDSSTKTSYAITLFEYDGYSISKLITGNTAEFVTLQSCKNILIGSYEQTTFIDTNTYTFSKDCEIKDSSNNSVFSWQGFQQVETITLGNDSFYNLETSVDFSSISWADGQTLLDDLTGFTGVQNKGYIYSNCP